ncbi:hypothetical protein SPRG_00509 [Saprolegnia parasitica CBS 223.65]|uniref:Carbonic anhydrase n=1 Tax=Saprolegnia parasitica (strain CBS 223.65) TaxID=695850 RepID=A0A067DAW8_SAPPC|nr:hypothetical protein SPRG_00509 [Saprolegnia parasitica CBS 223.65]KDO35766.1 hypothetical protein SPRG_00509 [Saprolegnia parasitica CBS 223.65]|eukprot:XP_012193993.1 hypothetical protein SPRG_00509 [Saprolegnia parasitica CBS 223.65]
MSTTPPRSPHRRYVPGPRTEVGFGEEGMAQLLERNREWAEEMRAKDPNFFAKLVDTQSPEILWIGCSDSRVPANEILKLPPGEVFVHRNIANQVISTDLNCLSVIEYAVKHLKVKHIIVCGHYGCGGVNAALSQKEFGIVDNWLRSIKDLYIENARKFLDCDDATKSELLIEENVARGVYNVCHTRIVQNAWEAGQQLSVHGWCYRLKDGIIRDLGLCITGMDQDESIYRRIHNKSKPETPVHLPRISLDPSVNAIRASLEHSALPLAATTPRISISTDAAIWLSPPTGPPTEASPVPPHRPLPQSPQRHVRSRANLGEGEEGMAQLLERNRLWADDMRTRDPNFFSKLAETQSPEILWIGCSDSRVPANEILDLPPGEVFVHRNIANQVISTDLNCLSVIEYAVKFLKVKHIIVCGHYGCGGVNAALSQKEFGIVDNWLRSIKDLYIDHARKFLDCDDAIKSEMLVEENVARGVYNVCHTRIVQNAWEAGQSVSVHGWCYRLKDGIIRDLGLCVTGMDQVETIYRRMREKTQAAS